MTHAVILMANNSSVHYFTWFAELTSKYPDIKLTFIALHKERPAMLDEMEELGCDCIWVYFDSNKRKRSMVSSFFKLYRIFRRIKPDAVNPHLFDDAVPSLFAAKLAGVPVRAVTKQDTWIHYNYNPGIMKFDRFNNRNASVIVAVSEESKEFILNHEKANPEKVIVVHQGISPNVFHSRSEEEIKAVKDKFGLHNRKIVAAVGRLTPLKNNNLVIEAAEKVISKHPEALFVFVGSGDPDYKEELKTMIRNKGLENHFIITGWVDKQTLANLYSVMCCMVHTSQSEAFGFVIAEAMMSGTCIVSTARGCARDVFVHKENGYLAEENNPVSLAEGINYVIENCNSGMGTKARETALKYFDVELMFQRYLEIYNNTFKK
ncbi:MAG: glycosyltransferase family 4 protein [Bacteroidota bacterium]